MGDGFDLRETGMEVLNDLLSSVTDMVPRAVAAILLILLGLLVAKIAETLDEISGGRYILGIGAGNVPASDYAAFGILADKRYSRFAEAIEIIHELLKSGRVDFAGEYWSARIVLLIRLADEAPVPNDARIKHDRYAHR